MKGKCYVFSRCKQRKKVYFGYLECKLEENGYVRCTFKLKGQKTIERTYLETGKQQTRYR